MRRLSVGPAREARPPSASVDATGAERERGAALFGRGDRRRLVVAELAPARPGPARLRRDP
ncbi:hypothetical protein [Sorangium sp. So ce341]|uniref:hypothetical protein n=1 Tax=Sorangium sp. So ce341 TaxID=3133302 RepID=UPI003F5EFC34